MVMSYPHEGPFYVVGVATAPDRRISQLGFVFGAEMSWGAVQRNRGLTFWEMAALACRKLFGRRLSLV